MQTLSEPMEEATSWQRMYCVGESAKQQEVLELCQGGSSCSKWSMLFESSELQTRQRVRPGVSSGMTD
jgi:hypothetical protein